MKKKSFLLDTIQKNIDDIEFIIKNILIDKKIDKSKLPQLMSKITNYVRTTMKDRFNYKDSLFNFTDTSWGNPQYTSIIHEYPDFVNWSWIALHVPFYQSLGDTIGYYNGNWEFNYNNAKAGPEMVNELIYDFISLGGINDLSITNWKASDDTILYMETYKVLTENFKSNDLNLYGQKFREAYIKSVPLIKNRHPGNTTMNSLEIQENIKWNELPYNKNSIGAGAAMRTGCIGIFFIGPKNRENLINLSIISCIITHNSTTAILSSITTALFTSYALENIPINLWPHKLLKLLKSPIIENIIQNSAPKIYPFYLRDKFVYIGQWETYIALFFSGINPRTDLRFMKNLVQRYKYLSENFSKNCDVPGSCEDAVIMAYDSLLQSNGVFEQIIFYSILHPGDSDTIGSIALSWFGAFYNSPRNQVLIGPRFKELEFNNQLTDLFDQNIEHMIKIYFVDIYFTIAKKYLKSLN